MILRFYTSLTSLHYDLSKSDRVRCSTALQRSTKRDHRDPHDGAGPPQALWSPCFAICEILNDMMTLDNEDFLVASSSTCARIQIVLIIICTRNAVNLRDYLFFWSVIFFLRRNILKKMSTKCKSQCNDGRNYKNNTT